MGNKSRFSIELHVRILVVANMYVNLGVLCTYGINIDALARCLGSYGGEDRTSDIIRGTLAGTISARQLLKIFVKYKMDALCKGRRGGTHI